MTVTAVDDPGDPRLSDYTKLTDVALRAKREPAEGLFMAESLNVIARAAEAGFAFRSVLTEAKWLPHVTRLIQQPAVVPVYVGTPEVIAATTGFRMHRGPMAAMRRRGLPSVAATVAPATIALILDGLVDHTNVGAAFRSAAALGVDAVLVTPDCADPLYRRSVRVSMGTVFQIPWTRIQRWWDDPDLAAFVTVALTPDPDAEDLKDFAADRPPRVALVVGSEGPGLEERGLHSADYRVRIAMAGGVDSLNVAAAVAVASFALS